MYILLLIVLGGIGSLLFAQESDSLSKSYRTQKLNGHKIALDGQLDEPAWADVDWGGGDFTQRQPNEGDAPSYQTKFKILYDDNFLYVGVRAEDTEPEKIEKRMSRRDGFAGDWVEINIDSYFDKQTAFSFTMTSAGVKGDEFISQNGDNWDSSWDPVWYLETSSDASGWTAEAKIPFSQLRFGEKNEQVWGIQFTRRIFRKNERSNWVYVPQNSTGWVHHFGELHGIAEIKPQKQIEILPYSVAKHDRIPAEDGNPFMTGTDNALSFGVDGKIGITSDIIVDFTINPDFGQVEADPSEVNLTAFETFFSEKRPFFIEGRSILDFRVTQAAWGGSYGRDNLFYSRRIGRQPHNYPALEDNEYADVPVNTSILGAAKVSGKTKNGWSFGIIESITAEESATIDAGGQRRSEVVEPAANYFVGRIKKDINEANTVFGAIVTAVNRNINTDELRYLHDAAYTGGIDVSHNMDDRNYYVSGNMIWSHVRGDTEALTLTQESSARYFQRPDANHLDLDTSLTALSGHGGTLKFGKRGNFKYQTGVTWRSPGIELNDIGFLSRADETNHWAWMGYRVSKPTGIFNNMGFNVNTKNTWDFGGRNLGNLLNNNNYFQFKNFWNAGYSVTREFNRASNSLLRGGPSMLLNSTTSFEVWFNSDQRKKIRGGGGVWNLFGDANSARIINYFSWMNLQPSNRFSLSFNPFYTDRENELQYVSEIDSRYIFGTINQKTAGITLRLNLNITPEFTVEYYGSPFVSAGEYSEFKNVIDPMASNYEDRFVTYAEGSIEDGDDIYHVDENGDGVSDFSIDNPDFNFRAFNSNLVLRWEYSPGSTLFVVWSQSRSHFVSDGRFAFNNDIDELFEQDAQNIFLIKFNRWFSL